MGVLQVFLRNRLLVAFVAVTTALAALSITVIYAKILPYPPIRSDGFGYYLYLPAIFIYQDVGLEKLNAAWGGIPPEAGRNWNPETHRFVIRFSMGVAMLQSPFFWLACLTAMLMHVPMDGFSPPFQYSIAAAGCVYALVGMVLLWRILSRHFRPGTILLAMAGSVYGTNLFHYATCDSIFSHAFSFFLFTAFLYSMQQIYHEGRQKYWILAGALAGLILLIRPTNVLWLIVGALYGVVSLRDIPARLRLWWQHRGYCALALLAAFIVLIPQLVYWKLVANRFLTYTYGGERILWDSPHLLNVLFSVRKGLFFWSPFWLTVLPGLFFLKKKAPEYFLPALVFLPVNAYVISAWHCWWYGGSFGQRPFVESIPLLAVAFASFYEAKSHVRGWRIGLVIWTALCAAWSCWMMVNYWMAVIPYWGATWKNVGEALFLYHR